MYLDCLNIVMNYKTHLRPHCIQNLKCFSWLLSQGAPCVPASGSLTAATIGKKNLLITPKHVACTVWNDAWCDKLLVQRPQFWYDYGEEIKCWRALLPEESHIFNPADQSVDKSACRASTATESGITVRKVLQKVWAPPAFSMPQRTSEVSLLPKKGRDKLVSLFADLLSFPSADRQPEAERKRMSLYESMSPAFGNELKSATTAPTPQESQREEREVIYENCLKCQGEHCHPPPRAEMFHIRNFPTVQTSSSELNLKKRPEGEVAVNESVLSRGDIEGWQSVDAQCRYEEMNVHSVTVEGKRCLLKFPLQLITKPLAFLCSTSSPGFFLTILVLVILFLFVFPLQLTLFFFLLICVKWTNSFHTFCMSPEFPALWL